MGSVSAMRKPASSLPLDVQFVYCDFEELTIFNSSFGELLKLFICIN